MKYNRTRPAPGQLELIQKKLWIAFAIAIVSFAVMSSLPVPVAGLGFGVLALCYNGFQIFEWFTNSLEHGDIWRMNLRKNIEAKYNIRLPRIPEVTERNPQPIKFTHDGTEYTMLFRQDEETFEPFIFPESGQQSVNPEIFLRNK